MSQFAMWVGYATMGLGAVVIITALAILVCYLINVSFNRALKYYGGWKVFQEFVKWAREHKPTTGATP